MEKIKFWIKENKVEFCILLAIIFFAALLRLYKIGDYMTFLGDEGRDVVIVRRFLTQFRPPLIGPGTSIGNMYLGPIYYYMMAIPLLIANFSPIGPAVMIAIFGVITVLLIWYIFREWFPSKGVNWGAIISAGFYAISPTVIIFSRSSWNPNIMPLFALLSIYFIWKVYAEKKYKWLILLGISFGIVLQSHYLGLLLLPVILIYWILGLKNSTQVNRRKYINYSLIALFLFLFLMSPLLIFDIRHNFLNTNAFISFATTAKGPVSVNPLYSLNSFIPVVVQVFTRLIGAQNKIMGIMSMIIIIGTLTYILVINKLKSQSINKPGYLILLWLFIGVFGLTFYHDVIYDHYLGFLFPVPFLLFGLLFTQIQKNKYLQICLFCFAILLIVVNIINLPVLRAPNMQMPRVMAVARVIQEKADGKKFNLATISDNNNRDVYQYFLNLWGEKVVDTDPSALQFTVTDQLFVVCEKPETLCDPIHNPSAWITSFGWTKIIEKWEIWGGTLYKLGHAK